jgi:hypothetical protein
MGLLNIGLPRFGPEPQFKLQTPKPNLRFRFSYVWFSLLGPGLVRGSGRWNIGSNRFEPISVIGCSKILMIKNLLQKWKECWEKISP